MILKCLLFIGCFLLWLFLTLLHELLCSLMHLSAIHGKANSFWRACNLCLRQFIVEASARNARGGFYMGRSNEIADLRRRKHVNVFIPNVIHNNTNYPLSL